MNQLPPMYSETLAFNIAHEGPDAVRLEITVGQVRIACRVTRDVVRYLADEFEHGRSLDITLDAPTRIEVSDALNPTPIWREDQRLRLTAIDRETAIHLAIGTAGIVVQGDVTRDFLRATSASFNRSIDDTGARDAVVQIGTVRMGLLAGR